jgi:prevent-host-death family protein
MTRIGVRELRQNASRYLDRVKAGETVEVTERGVLVAVLQPPTPAASERERLISAGQLIPSRRPRRIPTPAPGPSQVSTEDALDAERLDR